MIVVALLTGAITVLLAVLFSPQWAYLGIVAVATAAFGTQVWIYANTSSEFIKGETYSEGRYVTRMALARTALADALDAYDEAIGREMT